MQREGDGDTNCSWNTGTKNLEKGPRELESRKRIEAIRNIVQRSTRILRRVLENL